ncbi:MAG: FAD-dependent oxidoreductase [Steroidobacteraceae bacterium]
MTITRRGLIFAAGSLAADAAPVFISPGLTQAAEPPTRWTLEADVVVVGSGASGFPASIVAREAGNSVILVEAQPHTGGHGTCSGGHVPLGGGTRRQRQYGIKDSPDLVFRDLTDWSVVEENGAPDYRYNDREVVRAFANNSVATFDFLEAHGVVFIDKAPDPRAGESVGNSVPRENHAAVMDWPMVQTGGLADPAVRKTMPSGNGLIRPLEAMAKKAGVRILTEHRMTAIYRREPYSGPVLGVAVDNQGRRIDIRARKAVIIATGGSSGNVNFRRMFDPRLTEEYCGIAGMPWSDQDASGEMAAMKIGASLWGAANYTAEFGFNITKAGAIGAQYIYSNLRWEPGSPVFHLARAIGLRVRNWQDLILVNMLGQRFYDETAPAFSANNYDVVEPYTYASWRNLQAVPYRPRAFLDAALQGIGDGHNGGGPIWAIFDADAVAREHWTPSPPYVDYEKGFFFSANSLADLARSIKMQYQRLPMKPETLEAAIQRYNGFVDVGVDADFGKPNPRYKVAKPPFYAAWATPVLHDTRAGLRINGNAQVMDMHGAVVPRLYACGEAAGGFSQHGLGRATCQGFIAGTNAALESRV